MICLTSCEETFTDLQNMNKYALFVVSLTLALLSFSPGCDSRDSVPKDCCVTQTEANKLSSRFVAILSKVDSDLGSWSQTAEVIVGEN